MQELRLSCKSCVKSVHEEVFKLAVFVSDIRENSLQTHEKKELVPWSGCKCRGCFVVTNRRMLGEAKSKGEVLAELKINTTSCTQAHFS